MTDGLGLGTVCSGGVAPGYTVVVFTPTHVVLMGPSTSLVLETLGSRGKARPATDEIARKAVRAWKCILCLKFGRAWVVFEDVNERATNEFNDCFLQAQ